jgi:hypothetical protein
LTLANAATGGAPALSATGGDTNIGIALTPKGTGGVLFPAGAVGTPSITTTGDTNTGIFFPAADTIAFAEGGAEAMRIDSSGNVGIGTSSPSGKLNISGTSTTARITGTDGTAILRYNNGTSDVAQLVIAGGNTLLDYQGAMQFRAGVNGSEVARIDSSGAFLLTGGNTSTAVTASVGFRALQTGFCSATMSGSTNATDTLNVYSTGAAAYRFYVQMDGKINATSNTIAAISDIRLKENVRDLDFGLSEIMLLKPRRFDWKEGKGQDKKDVAGFIAQEFETVFPECVGTSKAGADGIEYKNISHETLIPTLVKAIQEQQALITALTTRITALEAT